MIDAQILRKYTTRRMHRAVVSTSLLLILNSPDARASDPSTIESKNSKGYVFVDYPISGNSDLLTFQSIEDHKTYKLTQRNDAGKSTFGAWLPAGSYRLWKWNDDRMPDYMPVRIEAGRVTDLGNLVVFPLGGYDYVVLPFRHPDSSHDIDAVISELGPSLVSVEPITWSPTEVPSPIHSTVGFSSLGLVVDLLMAYDRKVNKPPIIKQLREVKTIGDFYRLAVSAQVPLYEQSATDKSGTLFFGTKLGQVRVRRPAGEWETLDTGTLSDVSAIFSRGTALITGSPNGVLRISEDSRTNWKDLKKLPFDKAVVGIERAGNRWLITTARQILVKKTGGHKTDLFSIYAASSEDLSDLQLAKELPIDESYMTSAWRGANSHVFGHFFFVSAYPSLFRLDVDTMEWTNITPPTQVDGFSVSKTTGVLAAYHSKGIYSKLYVSDDNGASWKERKAPPFVILDIQFNSLDSAWAARINLGAFRSTMQLLEYSSAANDWKPANDAPFGCTHLFHTIDDAPGYCATTGGSILSYDKNEWKVEYSNE